MINNDKNTTLMTDTYYTIEEVSKMLRIAYLTVYRWIRTKKLPAIKAGKQYRISKTALDKFVNRRK